jgi:hypothetical protein
MRNRRHGQRGQALVVMVVAMIPALLMVSLIVDGGNAWAQQRITQNGTDAASNGGATVLARRLGGEVATDPQWDAQVKAAVDSNAAANGITVPTAWYTDWCGELLRSDGTKASGTGDAAVVGSGTLPPALGSAPDTCGTNSVGPVAGVMARGEHTFDTFIARIVGIDTYTANTEATSVTGYLQQTCSGSASINCILLPMAYYVNLMSCDNGGNAEDTGQAYNLYMNQPQTVLPICHNAAGNVGWLDWTSGGGGTNELINCVYAASTSNPCQPTITTPTWWRVAQAGNTNSKPLEDALNSYVGQIVLLPIFNVICAATPDTSQSATAPYYGCPAPSITDWNGANGNPDWYHLQPFAPFLLERAYTNGNNDTECDPATYGYPPYSAAGGAKNCIVGQFVDYTVGSSGTIGPVPGSTGGVIGVQLIH